MYRSKKRKGQGMLPLGLARDEKPPAGVCCVWVFAFIAVRISHSLGAKFIPCHRRAVRCMQSGIRATSIYHGTRNWFSRVAREKFIMRRCAACLHFLLIKFGQGCVCVAVKMLQRQQQRIWLAV